MLCRRTFPLLPLPWGLLASGLFLAFIAPLGAQSGSFLPPAWRGAPASLYAGWDDFAFAIAPNPPDRPGSDLRFRLLQTETTAFLTSGGNLYSFLAPLAARIEFPPLATPPTQIVLQTHTLGATLDPATVQLEQLTPTGTWETLAAPTSELLAATTTDSPGGIAIVATSRWTWQLAPEGSASAAPAAAAPAPAAAAPAPAASALVYRIVFQAAGTSLSLAAVSLDLAAAAAPATDPYALWLAARFSPDQLAQPLHSGQTADPDQDGLPNLLEYALGGEPQDAASRPAPVAALGSRTLQLAFTRIADPALVYTVEASPDLVAWETPPVYTTTGLANQPGLVVVTDRHPLEPGHPRRFLRLVVSRP